ncbi:MAG TPA: CocE/NonD family hydrolase [Gemmatimonadales bacterium]|nr:CocE/NonD family hydrolase [Gemmatimonadales bacterium]
MRRKIHGTVRAATVCITAATMLAITPASPITPLVAQGPAAANDSLREARWKLERELQEIAIVDRKVMLPMRDGVRLATDIYRPKNANGPVPTIFVKTPYNFNYWDVRNGAPRDMSAALTAIKRGYAYIQQNERGHFFSEGNYDILGPPRTDGVDAIEWINSQSWSNGKLGTIGCSSTAEWQMGAAALKPKGYAAMVPQGYGAGVGRVGPYYEQGNWYRGGAVQMLFITWINGQQNQVRPMFPVGTSQEDLIAASRMFDLAPQMPPVDWNKALWHLPVQDILKEVGGPRGIFADSMPVATGGRMIQRTPNDPAWYRGGLYHDDMPFDTPAYWFMSWYDVSVGPNLELFNIARKKASPEIADKQYAVIAPVAHCAYTRATENTIVGERSVGDPRMDYDAMTYGWFDYLLKGEQNGLLDTLPRVRYYTMGSNEWQTAESWPPEDSKPVTYYLTSGGSANTLNGDGRLVSSAPRRAARDTFTYDPLKPVTSYGGNVCCTGNAVQAGAFDQRKMEERPDILVYTTEPFKDGLELSGQISVTLYVESDAKDTDFTVKLIDVAPDGTAYNLDETIQRMRYRNGYDKPLVWMEKGKVAKVTLQPMNTSNYFAPGHSLRIEVSSSNFPRFDRNLNTGGNNYDEKDPVVAHNAVHHSRQYPSSITISVRPRK